MWFWFGNSQSTTQTQEPTATSTAGKLSHLLLVTCFQWGVTDGCSLSYNDSIRASIRFYTIRWPRRPVDPVSPKCPTLILATWTQRQIFLWLRLIQEVTSSKTSTDQTILSIREKYWFTNRKHAVFHSFGHWKPFTKVLRTTMTCCSGSIWSLALSYFDLTALPGELGKGLSLQ